MSYSVINATVAHWLNNKDIKKILPAQVDIDLTNNCNQDCYYCMTADFRRNFPVQQTYKDYIVLLDKLASWREHTPNSYGTTHAITYAGGGEPTLLKYYERVIEHSIDCGFLVSLTTNGTLLDKLLDHVPEEKLKKLNWIGIDIDSADPDTYEKIRRSDTSNMFSRVINNARRLREIDVNVDFKSLLDNTTSLPDEIEKMFQLGSDIKIRKIYYRPVIDYDKYESFNITNDILETIDHFSKKYNVAYSVNLSKSAPREYKKCHQMFQFPVFCADGKIYTCCDHKGDERFCIGDWMNGDFRDEWLNDRHWEVYNNINTHLCPPCRANNNNNQIEQMLKNSELLEVLNT